jgi:hypothetical protein
MLEKMRQFAKAWFTLELVIWPLEVLICLAVGYYDLMTGILSLGVMLLLTWVYFDARKQVARLKPPSNEGEL